MDLKTIFTEQNLHNISAIIADTNRGLTKSELERHLRESRITLVSDESYNNGIYYKVGLNKRDWLYNCLANEINTTHSFNKVVKFIEIVMNPINYTKLEKREKYQFILEELNKILLLLGYEIDSFGKLTEIVKANNLDEVDRRVNSLKKKLYDRNIHSEVTKYCINDYLREDYFDTVFEATKGLAERVREISGLNSDGNELFQNAFATKNPYIILNMLATDSEKNEYNGLKELLIALFHLVRNPMAHTPKINWKQNENEALDILTIISFAHKYLDKCYKNPSKNTWSFIIYFRYSIINIKLNYS